MRWPDRVLFLDLPPAATHGRLVARAKDVDDIAWLEAADVAYRSLPEWGEFAIVDDDRPPAAVLNELTAQAF